MGRFNMRSNNRVVSDFCQMVSGDLAFLAFLHNSEPDDAVLSILREEKIQDFLGIYLKQEDSQSALAFFDHVMTSMPRPISVDYLDKLAVDFASIYLNHNIHASPLESVWIDDDNLMCQQPMFEIRAWYEKYQLEVKDWRQRPDDHLVNQLHFLEILFSKAKSEKELLAQAACFMDEHLLRWINSFATRVAKRCDTEFFAALALLTAAYCEELRELLVQILGQDRPSQEEIEQRMKPAPKQFEDVPMQYMPGMGPAV